MNSKLIKVILTIFISITLLACQNQPQTSTNKEDVVTNTDTKTLVVYFSYSGNTKEMAEHMTSQTGADIYEIVPVNAYPTEYNECTEVALKERDENIRPAIKDPLEDISQYQNILIGYPIWWHTAPMIIGTFLESYDLTDINIYPFTQSASMNEEQFEQSMEFVKTSSSNGIVHDGLFVNESNIEAIDQYLSDNQLMK